MKKSYLILYSFFSLTLLSQELDQNYLDSLPVDVKSDVLGKMEAKESLEKPIYRRASTNIDKDIDKDNDQELIGSTLFGSNFFDTIQSSFMPINEPNLDSSYILDFGDVLEVQLLGQKNSIKTYNISRDGSINIEDLGKIILSGLSLNDASQLIKAKVNEAFIGTSAYISLKNVRDINILIVGNAFNPGVYTLNGNSNMLHAISLAGGINEYGSYRSIDLIRNGEIINTLDLYDVLVYGKYNLSQGLRTGDAIVVNPIKKVVSVESGVLRNGKFEIEEDETFKDLLIYSNGFSKNSDLKNIQIKRIIDGKSEVLSVNLNELYDFSFQDNDSIFIREHKFINVSIKGAVKNPGNYVLSQQDKLSDLIETAGGYEPSAYPFGGYLENQKALNINKNSKMQLYNKFLNNILRNSRTQIESETLNLILKQIQDAPVTGRVIAEFDLDLIKNNPQLDTILENNDKIFIPNSTQQVFIQGEISNPGAIRYEPNKDLDFYINSAGGALSSADLENIFIVFPNGETANFKSSSTLSFLTAETDKMLIYPGSIIYIPQSTKLTNSIEVASIWAPIISSIALSLTSLSVLNNTN